MHQPMDQTNRTIQISTANTQFHILSSSNKSSTHWQTLQNWPQVKPAAAAAANDSTRAAESVELAKTSQPKLLSLCEVVKFGETR